MCVWAVCRVRAALCVSVKCVVACVERSSAAVPFTPLPSTMRAAVCC